MNKIVSTYTLSADNTSIPDDKFAEGTYLVHIYNDRIYTIQKLIKI
jgi:hypothetical protein